MRQTCHPQSLWAAKCKPTLGSGQIGKIYAMKGYAQI